MAMTVFLNIKGGVAKTTTVIGVAEALASRGKRVLVIDADHQCAASDYLLGERRFTQLDSNQRTLHDLLSSMLREDFSPSQFAAYVANEASTIVPLRKNLSVLPCSFRINDFESNRAKARREFDPSALQATWRTRQGAFKKWVRANFDHAIVDCPPSLAGQVRFLLRASDGYVIPCVPDRISVRGALWLVERMQTAGLKAPALGVAWTLYRQQNSVHRGLVGLVGRRAADGESRRFQILPKPFKTIIPNATAIVAGAENSEPAASINQKYTREFADRFHDLATEIEAAAARVAALTPPTKRGAKPAPRPAPASSQTRLF